MEAKADNNPQTAPEEPEINLYERIRARFAGVELELPPREPGREPPRFE